VDYRAKAAGVCEQCANAFDARLDNVGRFCSLRCANLFQGGAGRASRAGRFRVSAALRLSIYERDSWICQACLEPVERDAAPLSDWFPSLDHVVPRSLGGADDSSNLRTLHRWCNSARGNLTHYRDEDFRVPIER